MRQSIALLSVLAGASFAADTVEFFFPGGSDGVDPVATIKKADPTTTVMHLACPSGVDSNDCGWGIGFDYTIISKTHYQAQISEDSFSMSFGCDHNAAKSQMVCAVAMSGEDVALSVGTQVATLSSTDISFNKATVVAGASLLSGAASASGSAASAAPKTTNIASASNTGLKTSVTPAASGSGSAASSAQASNTASGSAAPAQHTGAAARFGIEGSALLVLAGVAAANVL